MTPNEIYNKGLTDAENEALEKLSQAFEGKDTAPFATTKLEEFRLKLLDSKLRTTTYTPPENFGELDFSFKGLKVEQIPANEITSILLNEVVGYDYNPPVGSESSKVVKALKFLRDFIYTKAAKGNNGSKNYIYMTEELKNILK